MKLRKEDFQVIDDMMDSLTYNLNMFCETYRLGTGGIRREINGDQYSIYPKNQSEMVWRVFKRLMSNGILEPTNFMV